MNIVQSVCSQLTSIVSSSEELSDNRKNALNQKISQIAHEALNPASIKTQLGLEELDTEGKSAKESAKILIAKKILSNITTNSEEISDILCHFTEKVSKGRGSIRYAEGTNWEKETNTGKEYRAAADNKPLRTFQTVNLATLTEGDISEVFYNEITHKHRGKWTPESEQAALFYQAVVDQAIQAVNDEIASGKITPKEGVQKFSTFFGRIRQKMNEVTEDEAEKWAPILHTVIDNRKFRNMLSTYFMD